MTITSKRLTLCLSMIAILGAANSDASAAVKRVKKVKANVTKSNLKKKATKNRLSVQLVPFTVTKGGKFQLPHYYNHVDKSNAVSATLGKTQARLTLKLGKSLEYMPGVFTNHDKGKTEIQINGFKIDGKRTAPAGKHIVEGTAKTTYRKATVNARGKRIADFTHETSRERDIVFSVIQRGLKLGDVTLYANSGDATAHWHASAPSNRAYLVFSGKTLGLTEWIPKPILVSDIVKSIRQKTKAPSLMQKLSGGAKAPLSNQAIVNQVAAELSLK